MYLNAPVGRACVSPSYNSEEIFAVKTIKTPLNALPSRILKPYALLVRESRMVIDRLNCDLEDGGAIRE